MGRYNTTDPPQRDRAPVTAAEWFGGGQRIPYDPESARVLTEEEAVANPGALRVFERVAAAEQEAADLGAWKDDPSVEGEDSDRGCEVPGLVGAE